ncbi:putative transposase [Shigella boydii 5216-82]|nr:transposase [Shigella boydii]EGI92362.1 putative transposase [Shigella boydii 5216-82]
MNNELPDDIELLKAMLRKQQSRLRQYACQVAGYEQEIERLKAQLDRLRRMRCTGNSGHYHLFFF